MQIPEEILLAARSLGNELGSSADVQEYLRLKDTAGQNAEVVELENKMDDLYHKLAGQQQNGEALDQSELDEYYLLRRKVMMHPLTSARDNQLETVRGLFSRTARILTSILGVDYSTLAR